MEKAPEILSVLEMLFNFVEKTGMPGLLLLFYLGPALIVVALFALEFVRQRHDRRKEEEFRTMILDFQEKHAEVVQYYKDNVQLVKTTQQLAADTRDALINNTRAVENLTAAMRTNQYCPLTRKISTGV